MFLPPITTLSSIYISISLILISDLLLPFQLLMSTHQPLFEQRAVQAQRFVLATFPANVELELVVQRIEVRLQFC